MIAKEWPVAHITLPVGAAPAALPPVFANDPAMISSADPKHRLWFQCFNCPGGWEAVVQHIQSCVAPLGYAYSEADSKNLAPPQADAASAARVFASPSGKVKVAVTNLKVCALYAAGFGGGGEFLVVVAVDTGQR